MKTKVLTGLSLILFVLAGFATAEEHKTSAEKNREHSAKTVRQAPRGRGQSANRDQMYREMLAKRAESHRASIKELMDIKKLADEEGAVKTAAALQEMIDKKNDEFKKNMERFEMGRRQRSEKLKTREKKADDDTDKPQEDHGKHEDHDQDDDG
ncbi:MAG: hypothetical protein ACYSUT_01525 [Planctomycetota bacterium]|jgi:hypothetical protein